MSMETLFAIAGALSAILAMAALFLWAFAKAREVILWNYYRGLRKQISETCDMLVNEFPAEQKFSRDVVLDMLEKLHDRRWPRPDDVRWMQVLADEAAGNAEVKPS